MGKNLTAIDLGSNRTAVEIVAGWAHTCARLDNNRVKCWGNNSQGQLGQWPCRGGGCSKSHPNLMGDILKPISLGERKLPAVKGNFKTKFGFSVNDKVSWKFS